MLSHGRSTGFILEGFPHNTEEVEYMMERQLLPDIVVVMEAELSQVEKRLLPLYQKKWQVQHDQLEKRRSILYKLRKKNRVS